MNGYEKSDLLLALEIRISKIALHFNCGAVGANPSDEELDNILAYVLLCHAELESYFESVAWKIYNKTVECFNTNKTTNANLISIAIAIPFTDSDKPQKKRNYKEKINWIMAQYRKKLEDNHGIKRTNIESMFKPLGYELDMFDATWLSTLTSFGELRGTGAHNSISVNQQLDYQTQKTNIENIIIGIPDFEQIVFRNPEIVIGM